MRKLLTICCFLLCITSLISCGKGPDTAPSEENLNIKLNTANPATSTSSSYQFTVEVLSRMPAAGVKINITAKREDNSTVVFTQDLSSSTAVNSVTVSPLPMGQVFCTGAVTVTSATTSTNTRNGNFRVVWK